MGQFVSLIGDRISIAVFISLVATIVGGENSWTANLLIVMQYLPLFLFGYLFGCIADFYNKRNLMILSDMIRGFAILIVFFFHTNLYVIYASVFLLGVGYALFEPSRKSILPFIIPKEKLVSWNKIYAALEVVAILVGLAVGAFLLQIISIKTALLVDFSTYLVSILLLLFIRYSDLDFDTLADSTEKIEKKSLKHIDEIKQGIKYVASNVNVKVVFVMVFFHYLSCSLFFTAITEFVIKTTTDTMQVGPIVNAYLLLITIGALISYPLLNYLKKMNDTLLTHYLLGIGTLILVVLNILFYFFPNGGNFYGFEILLVLVGIAVGAQYLRFLYIIQLNTVKRFLGRTLAVYELVLSLVLVFGLVMGSYLNALFGYNIVFMIITALYFSAFLYLQTVKHKITW